jgi:hypothetical protein
MNGMLQPFADSMSGLHVIMLIAESSKNLKHSLRVLLDEQYDDRFSSREYPRTAVTPPGTSMVLLSVGRSLYNSFIVLFSSTTDVKFW